MQSNQSSLQRSRKRELADKMATLFLVIIGIIGFLIALLSLFDPLYKYVISIVPVLRSLNITALLLLSFSILALAIGLERYASFDEVREESRSRHSEVIQAINQIQQVTVQHGLNLGREIAAIQLTLINTIEAKVLYGPGEVYEEAIKLIKACEGSEIIRATSLDQFSTLESYTNLEKMPIYRTYLETLIKAIGQRKPNSIGMFYKVVVGLRPNERGELTPENLQIINKRKELFQNHNVQEKLEIKWLDSFWSLDVLIVGNKQMIIMFPTTIGERHHRLALRITHTKFVSDVTRWFDERPWREAKDLP